MISESLRSLFYFIGFIANFLFGLRFFLQWITSEKKKESVVTPSFWYISLAAHLLMCVHGFFQFQYPICLIQILSGCIAWRNLDLMKKNPLPLKKMVWSLLFSAVAVTLLFMAQGQGEWMRPPTMPWSGKQAAHCPLPWHIFGFFGMIIFASRSWIQWWHAEREKKSTLGRSFWLISCVGALLSLAYAIRLNDPVNIFGFGIGLIPYIRNLMLLKPKGSSGNNFPIWTLRDKAQLKRARLASERGAPFPNGEGRQEGSIGQSRSQSKMGNYSLTSPKIKIPEARSIFLFAGEKSGDLLGGTLIPALKSKLPQYKLYGVGGPEMKGSGLSLVHPMERFQVMGFSAVILALPRLFFDFRKIKNIILQDNPAAVILIDYPDFNMRLAKALRKKGYQGKIVHYVCPSVWAWRPHRVHSLAKTLDLLLAILPFEEKYFSQTKLPVAYVGHPLVPLIESHHYSKLLPSEKPIIAIFPGSRRHEIELNLPLQLAAAQKMGSGYQLAVSVASPQLEPLIRKYVENNTTLVPPEHRYDLMKQATGALATSGTIILELGLHGVPTLVTYKLSSLNSLLGRYIFRINLPFYSLVNIICEKEVYPEFIHRSLSDEAIYHSFYGLLQRSDQCRKECQRLRSLLQRHDASTEAAGHISTLIKSSLIK